MSTEILKGPGLWGRDKSWITGPVILELGLREKNWAGRTDAEFKSTWEARKTFNKHEEDLLVLKEFERMMLKLRPALAAELGIKEDPF